MFDAIVLSKLRYTISVYHGFLSAELKGQINAFLKRAFTCKYGFCTSVHTIDVIAEEADRSLVAKMAGSQLCLHTLMPILNHTVVVLNQKDTPSNYLNVVVIYTRNHLFQGACLDIVNILLR